MGANSEFNSGVNRLQNHVAHFTVGSDSRNIGRAGYFHFLVHRSEEREKGCTQYAPFSAATWHAGESSALPDANQRGPGTEYERLVEGGDPDGDDIVDAERLTDNMIYWGNRIIEFSLEWGIPADLYKGPRLSPMVRDWYGWINHADIDKDRHDGLTDLEWDQVVQGVRKPVQKKKGNDMIVVANQIEAGRPDAGRVLEVLYSEVSGVECGRVVEEIGVYGLGPIASSWIQQGASCNLTSPLGAFVVGTRMWQMAIANGVEAPKA
jgi:hypothetical protein